MHAVTINEERSHEFEGKWGREYGSVWRNEKKGRDVSIKLQSQKVIKNSYCLETMTNVNISLFSFLYKMLLLSTKKF